jgi:hypothetical protein
LTSTGMAWSFQEESARSASNFDVSFGGFSHTAYLIEMEGSPPVVSALSPLLLPLLYSFCDRAKLDFRQLLRIRIGLFPGNAISVHHHNPHVDFVQPHHTAVYYVNDSDGDTTIFRETSDDVSVDESAALANRGGFNVLRKVSPRQGRMLGFDGRHYHASMHPMKASKRLTITFNFV